MSLNLFLCLFLIIVVPAVRSEAVVGYPFSSKSEILIPGTPTQRPGIGHVLCSETTIQYNVLHDEIFSVLFKGRVPPGTLVHSVILGHGQEDNCTAHLLNHKTLGNFHELTAQYSECGITIGGDEETFVFNSSIVMRTRVYPVPGYPAIFTERILRQPFTCSGKRGELVSVQPPQYVEVITDLENIPEEFKIRIKADVRSDLYETFEGFATTIQVHSLAFGLYDDAADNYEVFVEECWGNFDQNPFADPRIPFVTKQGCLNEWMAHEIRAGPAEYTLQISAFKTDLIGINGNQNYVHCNVTTCYRAGDMSKCQKWCNAETSTNRYASSIYNRLRVTEDERTYQVQTRRLSFPAVSVITSSAVQPQVTVDNDYIHFNGQHMPLKN